MKYKDYYAILGVAKDATAEDIKTSYRRLARKYHPDVSKEKDAEAKFKEMGEAYETLKDPEKRAAYDQLGSHAPGQEFRPPPDWGQHYAQGQGGFDDIDLSDLFAGLAGRRRGANGSGAGNGKFKFVSAFSANATGQLRFDAANHLLLGSTDADSAAEFSILLTGVNSMTGGNFFL